MLDVLLPLALLLLLGYSFHVFAQRAGRRGKGKSELPVHRHPLSTSATASTWTFERHGLSWSISTGALNSVPGQLLDRRPERFKRALRSVYEFGSVVGVLGGAGAIATTVWTLVQVWMAVWDEARSHAAEHEHTVKVLKRALEHAAHHAKLDGLQPLVRPPDDPAHRATDMAG